MGLVSGWDEITDGTVLRGTGHSPHLSSSDGDWLLDVVPAPGYEQLLTSPDGVSNANGFVECEVEPRDNLPGGKNAEDENGVKEFIGAIDRRPVRVVGAWVTDNAHDAKTEI